MTWADTFNSCDNGRKLSNSMKNIKLDNNISPVKVQALAKKYAPSAYVVPQMQTTAQITPNQTVQFQPYTATPQYHPVQYSQAQFYQPQMPIGSYQNNQVQYQAPSCYSYPPVSQQTPNYTSGTPMTTSNAINAYSYQAQAPVQYGQNLNVSTDTTAAQAVNSGAQQVSMPTPSVQ